MRGRRKDLKIQGRVVKCAKHNLFPVLCVEIGFSVDIS